MIRVWTTTLFTLAVGFDGLAASAQAQSLDCTPRCRAVFPFTSCEKPRVAARLVSGRITRVFRDCPRPGLILEIELGRSEANELPNVVEIDIGPCVVFTGDVGDQATVAIAEPRPSIRRYKNVCER